MPDAASDTTQVAEKARPRQRQGSACVECRRRKLRCDGEVPSCGTCTDSGLECIPTVFTTPRGPKKGHMKALQNRLATLEARLQEQQDAAVASATIFDMSLPELKPNDGSTNHANNPLPTPPMMPNGHQQLFPIDIPMDMDLLQTLEFPLDPNIPELVKCDLDQIYFERAHSFAPILHRRRYFSWARLPVKTDSQRCLQYAIWALAAALSPQSENYRTSLRLASGTLLDELENADVHPDLIEIEQAQARVLLLVHDFLKGSFHSGWMGAGRCFRLLTFMRLYEIDAPQNVAKRSSAPQGEDVIRTEELRRTFWFAYSIDRFISLKSDRPITLQESVISVRLPVPDELFQSGQCPQRSFLSEAITSGNSNEFCSFSESIIAATICGRAMSHRQQAAVENVYGRVAQGSQFWDRHYWLEELLTIRLQVVRQRDHVRSRDTDSLLLFTKMTLHTMMLYLCQVMEAKTWSTPDDEHAALEFKHRSAHAAREMIGLSASLAHLSHFKVNPFTPLLLVVCADFLSYRHENLPCDDIGSENMLQLLSDMSSINNLANDGYRDTTSASPVSYGSSSSSL